MDARLLHDEVGHSLRLLRRHCTNLGFVKGTAGFELFQRLVSLFHLLGQRVKRGLLLGQDIFSLRLLPFIKIQIIGQESYCMLTEHAVSMHAAHMGPLHRLRDTHCDQQNENKRPNQYLDTIRFHSSSLRRPRCGTSDSVSIDKNTFALRTQ